MSETSALIQQSDTDYVLKPEHRSVWITVDSLALYIVRNAEGVSVDFFPANDASGESLVGTWCTFDEALVEEGDDDN